MGLRCAVCTTSHNRHDAHIEPRRYALPRVREVRGGVLYDSHVAPVDIPQAKQGGWCDA